MTNITKNKRSIPRLILLTLLVAFTALVILIIGAYLLGTVGGNIHPSRLAVPQYPNHVLLTNVNVLQLDQQPNLQKDVDIEVVDGKITAIAPTGDISPTSEVFDGKGMFVTPGLIDSHVHIEDSSYLSLALANGVTTVRGMRGHKNQLVWRDEINQSQWLGSRFLVFSPILDGHQEPFHQFVDTPVDVESLVREYADKGYDGIKVYGSMNPETYNRLVQTANEISLPVAKHGPFPVSGNDFSSLNTLQSLEHVENIFSNVLGYSEDPLRMKKAINQLKATNVPIVTTLSVFQELTDISLHKDTYLDSVPFQYMNATHKELIFIFGVDRWLGASEAQASENQAIFDILKSITFELYSAGIPIVVGSDSGALIGQAGLATHNEMAILASLGMPAEDVIKSATIAPAKMLNMESKLGRIQPGAYADFILTEQNPLDDISVLAQPNVVVSNGIFLNQTTLDELKENATHTQSSIVTLLYMLIDTIKKIL